MSALAGNESNGGFKSLDVWELLADEMVFGKKLP